MTETTAVVTGADTGMGESIARALLARGYRVLSIAKDLPAWRHERLHAIAADLADREGIEAAGEFVAPYAPTVVVHNAGAIRAAALEAVTLDDLHYLTNLHVGAAIVLTQRCLPAMKAARFGRVVLVSSRAAVGLATRTAYTATKAAQIGMARTWALELGPHGITVNVIAPGPVPTGMFREVIAAGSAQEQRLIESLPMRRLGTPGDIARAVLYFADPDNGFVTGQVLFVCGGASVGFLQI
jgi:NAD(P)-dependent dehydrogenase (short-subunit alcohol dehydrogenase family)